MKLIEDPFDISAGIIRWDTGDGEIYIEISSTNEGLELYCDGEGIAEFNITKNTINSAIIKPRLLVI